MSLPNGYRDVHLGEQIDAECPRCRLPIYASDDRRLSSPPWDPSSRLYHLGCALTAEGLWWEQQVQADVNQLRACGYTVQLNIIRPVR